MLCSEAKIMRDIVKGVSKKGSRCQNTVVNRGGVRERDRQIERWLGYILVVGLVKREREREREREVDKHMTQDTCWLHKLTPNTV